MDPQQAFESLQNQITHLQNEIQFLRSSISTTPSRPKPSLPDPAKFDGQSYKFDTWLPAIKAKLRVDNAAIGDAIAQFYYVYLNLDTQVQAIVLPQLGQAEELGRWDYNSILDQLARVYDNPNKVQEAEDRLLSLRQGVDSVPTYISKFERVLYESRGQNWSDSQKISIFRNGLNSTIRSRLNQQLDLPQRYPDFIRIIQRLSSRSTVQSSSNSNGNSNYQRGSEPMDIGAIGINEIDIPSRSTPRSTSPRSTPRSTSSPTGPRARSISPACRAQYRSEGRCVRCGAHNHWVEDCLLQPFKKQISMTALRDRNRALQVQALRDLATYNQEFEVESDLDIDAEISRLQRGEI